MMPFVPKYVTNEFLKNQKQHNDQIQENIDKNFNKCNTIS